MECRHVLVRCDQPKALPWPECGKKSHEKNRDMETKKINGIDAAQAASFQQSCTMEELARGEYLMTQEFSTRKHYRFSYRFFP